MDMNIHDPLPHATSNEKSPIKMAGAHVPPSGLPAASPHCGLLASHQAHERIHELVPPGMFVGRPAARVEVGHRQIDGVRST